MYKPFRISLVLIALLGLLSCNVDYKIDLQIDNDSRQVQLAISDFQQMAEEESISISGKNPDLVITSRLDSVTKSGEAYRVSQKGRIVEIVAGGNSGLVYGLNYVRDQIRMGQNIITPVEEEPHYTFRAVKFNLPWSTYRRGEALDLHYETCRDTLFWETFLNMMVENRFNKLTLWNLHPFNYLVKLEAYPEANSMTDKEFAEWRLFWNTLFRMAKDRGIETYLVNWNIFVSPEFAEAHNVATYSITGEYFIQGDTASIIKDYTRESVRAVIDEYPDLTGLGITLGEAMFGMTAQKRQDWILDGYIQGAREASRKIKFIYRAPLNSGDNDNTTMAGVAQLTRQTLDTLSCFDGPITIELKYNWSHAYSATSLYKVHGGPLSDAYWNPEPTAYKLAWMARNEDFFMLRWGQSNFIREHISQNSQNYVSGYFVGSETYIPAKDYFTLGEKGSWDYAFQRQWMYYKQWGRLLYNPQTPDSVFENAFESRFSGKGNSLYEAQSLIGRVPLIVASYWNASWDYTLYSEGMLSIMGQQTAQLISLKQMVEKIPMDTTMMSVTQYVMNTENNIPVGDKITPLMLADSMDIFCNQAINLVSGINSRGNIDLGYEKADILTWANLGLYFANKLRAAVEYKKFTLTEDPGHRLQAISHLEHATDNWEQLSLITANLYKEVPLQHYNRNDDKYFHWTKVFEEVKDELEWLRNEKHSNQN